MAPPAQPPVRTPSRAELLAALSIAIDLGLGQPAEHMLRSAVIATRIADRLGLDRAERDCTYYTALIMWIGCHADSHEYARWFGDDIAVRRDSYLLDWSGLPYLRFLMANTGRGQPVLRRLSVLATLLADARGQIAELIHSHCSSAGILADRLGLSADVQTVLGYTFERFDGGGLPGGVGGDAIPIPMRVAQLADTAEVHHRTFGVDGAVAMARSRSGGQFDPRVVDAFLADGDAILESPEDAWSAALREDPHYGTGLADGELDELLVALGDFVDLKCPFTLGHSRAVAELAAGAAALMGMDAADVDLVRRAGHVHDVGRIGVSNQVWSKSSTLTTGEMERVRLHPYLTVRILSQVGGLDAVARVAGNHHEYLDGSGYPRGLPAAALSVPDRVLAAAVATGRPSSPAPTASRCPRRRPRRGCGTACAKGTSTSSRSTPSCPRRGTRPGASARGPEGSLPARSKCCAWSPAVLRTRRSPQRSGSRARLRATTSSGPTPRSAPPTASEQACSRSATA